MKRQIAAAAATEQVLIFEEAQKGLFRTLSKHFLLWKFVFPGSRVNGQN